MGYDPCITCSYTDCSYCIYTKAKAKLAEVEDGVVGWTTQVAGCMRCPAFDACDRRKYATIPDYFKCRERILSAFRAIRVVVEGDLPGLCVECAHLVEPSYTNAVGACGRSMKPSAKSNQVFDASWRCPLAPVGWEPKATAPEGE